MRVRPEEEADRLAIHAVNRAAFETSAEATLVDVLRAKASAVVSLVAEVDGHVVGHIMFSPVTFAGQPAAKVVGLAPMAVLPERQRAGIGSALVLEGLTRCRQLGYQAVVVLGHPEFYPRFGFVPASRYGIRCDYDAPDDAFMIIELQPHALRSLHGLARYDEAFDRV
jgi:putative acetyltransferase